MGMSLFDPRSWRFTKSAPAAPAEAISWPPKVELPKKFSAVPIRIAVQKEIYPMSFKLSSFLAPIGHLFQNAFTKQLPALETAAKTELTLVEQSIIAFCKSDLGKLAVDAVSLASAKLTGDEAFAAAKSQFISDAKAAGHNLEVLGKGQVDWMIQTAYTFVAGVFANLSAASADPAPAPPAVPTPAPAAVEPVAEPVAA